MFQQVQGFTTFIKNIAKQEGSNLPFVIGGNKRLLLQDSTELQPPDLVPTGDHRTKRAPQTPIKRCMDPVDGGLEPL